MPGAFPTPTPRVFPSKSFVFFLIGKLLDKLDLCLLHPPGVSALVPSSPAKWVHSVSSGPHGPWRREAAACSVRRPRAQWGSEHPSPGLFSYLCHSCAQAAPLPGMPTPQPPRPCCFCAASYRKPVLIPPQAHSQPRCAGRHQSSDPSIPRFPSPCPAAGSPGSGAAAGHLAQSLAQGGAVPCFLNSSSLRRCTRPWTSTWQVPSM